METINQTINGQLFIGYVVKNEQELNTAFTCVNNSQPTNLFIDVVNSFTLTGNTVPLTNSVLIKSSNGSSINDGGNAFLTLSNGITVQLSMNAGGTGTSVLGGQGEDTELLGLQGGAIGNLNLQADGKLVVPFGNTFSTNGIYVSQSGINLGGVLNNQGEIYLYDSIITNPTNAPGGAQANVINLGSEGNISLSTNTTFKAQKIIVPTLAFIDGDSTPTIVCDNILVQGTSNSSQCGWVYGVNISGKITLESTGTYTCQEGGTGPGCNATEVYNDSGIFDLRSSTIWNVGTYTQNNGAVLTLTIPDFTGNAPLLNIGNATLNGGQIIINAGIYHIPPGTVNQHIKIMNFSNGVPANFVNLVSFNGFPQGMVPSIQVVGNDVYLNLTV